MPATGGRKKPGHLVALADAIAAPAGHRPDPDRLFGVIEEQLKIMCTRLGPQRLARLSGIGVAARLALDQRACYDERALQAPWLTHTSAWLDDAARAIAFAINGATCLLDLEGVIIDGSIDRALLDKLLIEVEKALGYYSWEGVVRPIVLAGTIGSDARAMGAALLPLYANFGPNRDLFLKNTPI